MHVDAVRVAPVAFAGLALGRTAAVAAVGSAVAHVLLLDSTSLGSLAMIGMALACLPCAWHLWRGPTPAVWGMTATVDGAMLAVHLPMLTGTQHQHGDVLPWLAAALVVTQLALAAAATWRRRLRGGDEPPTG